MSFLLAQADFLTTNDLQAGISEETVEEDNLLRLLPFEDIAGFQQVEWNRENSLGSLAAFRSVNEEIAESAPTYSNQTQALSILSTREEIDRFNVETKSAVQNVLATTIATKAKQVMRTFHNEFYYGTALGASSKGFAGLHNLVSSSSPDMVVGAGSGSTGSGLSLLDMDKMMQLVKPGRPDALIMNRTMIRRLSAPYIANIQFNIAKDSFGDVLPDYSGIPIAVTDFITQEETISGGTFSAKTGGVTTSMFAVKFGRGAGTHVGSDRVFNNDGVLGVQGGGMRVFPPHQMEKKSGWSIIVEWYVTVILGSQLSLARVDGITDAAATV